MEIKDKVERVYIGELEPYDRNPKRHPEEQVDKIARSIKQYGFTQPIVISEDKEIIIGHGRVEACEKLGIKEIPAIIRDDLNDQEIRALRIADNKVAESEWEMHLLEIELEEIDYEELETGFDIEEIENLLDPIDIIDMSGEEDTRDNRTRAGGKNVIVSFGTFAETVNRELVDEAIIKIEEKFEGDQKLNQFVEWFLDEN